MSILKFSFIVLLFININASHSEELKLKFDMVQDDHTNVEHFYAEADRTHDIKKIVIEFDDSSDLSRMFYRTATKNVVDSYQRAYPNGDFYYLIGDLDDAWTKSDYGKFYSVAKWLALRGFRTIINVAAYAPDLQEALANPKTTAILWNSHGSSDGSIIDTGKTYLAKDIFTKHRKLNLKYVLFANCYGQKSAVKYGLKAMKGVLSEGWAGTTTSDELFEYLFSKSFDAQLEKAFGNRILVKQTRINQT